MEKRSVLLIYVNVCTRRSPDHKKYRKKITEKLQKEKLSGSRLVMKFLLFTRRNRRDIPIDTMFLHTATVAEEVHFVYLLITTKKCYFVDLIIMVLSTFE